MESLAFGSLPLREVNIRLVSLAPLPATFERLSRVREEAEAVAGNVVSFSSLGGVPPFRLTIGAEEALHLHGDQLDIKVSRTEIVVLWHQDLHGPYGRFEMMLRALLTAARPFEDHVFTYANMTYINAPAAPPWWEYIKGLSLDFVQSGKYRDLNVAFETLSGLEYRLGAQQVGTPEQPQGSLLVTTCGALLHETTPEAAIRNVHKELIAVFPSLLSARAKEEWQYDDNHTSE